VDFCLDCHSMTPSRLIWMNRNKKGINFIIQREKIIRLMSSFLLISFVIVINYKLFFAMEKIDTNDLCIMC
jgi:hypothetical protein